MTSLGLGLELDDVVDGLDDVVGGDAEHLEELGGGPGPGNDNDNDNDNDNEIRPGPGHGVDGELPDDHVAVRGDSVQHSVTQTSL